MLKKGSTLHSLFPFIGHRALARACLNTLPHLSASPSNPIPIKSQHLRSYVLRFWTSHLAEDLNPNPDTVGSPAYKRSKGMITDALSKHGIEVVREWARLLFRDIIHSPDSRIGARYKNSDFPTLLRDVAAALDDLWASETVDDSKKSKEFGDIERVTLQVACLDIATSLEARADFFDDLGRAHMVLAKHRIFDLEAVKKAIWAHRCAVTIVSQSAGRAMDKARFLSSLAQALVTQAELQGNNEGMEEATRLLEEVLALHPPNHPDRCNTLARLADCLRASESAHSTRNCELLDESIHKYREALELLPEKDSQRASVLQGLALALSMRSEAGAVGSPSDESAALNLEYLEESIALDLEAIELPDGKHPHVLHSRINIGASYRKRFHLLGRLEDLDNSTKRLRDVVEETPSGDPFRAKALFYLLLSLQDKANVTPPARCTEILQEIIKVAEEALASDYTSNDQIYLSCLLNSRRRLFTIKRSIKNLEEAIRLARVILKKTPTDLHEQRALYMMDLAVDLKSLFYEKGEAHIPALEDSIEHCEGALLLCPQGHVFLHSSLTLAWNLRLRSKHTGRVDDLQKSISISFDMLYRSDDPSVRKDAFRNLLGCRDIALRLKGKPGITELGALEQCFSQLCLDEPLDPSIPQSQSRKVDQE
ncbi:hypothetical protein NMY22_g15475 [Coprinellus aureogranulatus]|nr:hypothetical protein NMY22_g15475 [Coprinellus aureogranulatus]